ncbi:MAG: mechanosensitive ion channel [Gammaproteobacteria bacterium]|nr:mechanosensitive ion channel [Gammaproteobacteria bacterium]NNJ72643.1 mechanosensitive ion channel [Enterobacterales bacterium]
MQELIDLLNYPVFTFNNEVFTIIQMVKVPLVLLLGYWLIKRTNKLIQKVLVERKLDANHQLMIQRLYMITMLVILGMFTLSLLRIPLTAFTFISGAIAIGVGFGAQNIINNFISGWILMWERPIRIGDFLEIGDVKGTVETINTRSTRVRRTDGVHLLIPNSHLLENTVVNWTLVDRLARAILRVGIAYGSPSKKAAALIEQAAFEHPDIHDDPEPLVIFEDFGDNALIFDLYFWIDSFGERDIRVIRSDIRFRIEELFKENNIVIAFPQRDIHVDGELLVTNKTVD